jgi:branched-chain amino acid transport system substrate-binding protein
MKKGYLPVLFVLVLATVLAACGPAKPEVTVEDEWGVVEVAPGDPIKVAVNVVTSGAGVDVLGLDELRATEIAVADRGEIKGHSIEIVHEDTLCSAEGGQTAATKTVADASIVAVVGHTCSSSCTPASTIYAENHYTMVAPSCTAPSLTAEDTHEVSFLRTAFNDNYQSVVAARFAYNELGARKAATIHDGSPYAEQLQGLFADEFENLGGEVVAQEAVNTGDTDMRPVLTTIAALEPDIIYYPIFPAEGGFIAQQRFDVGLDDVLMMGADGIWATTFSEAAGDAAVGVYCSGGGAAGAEYEAFLDKYLEEYGEVPPAPFHAHSYDAMNMILNAIEKVAVDSDGTLFIGRKALSDALYATANYKGLTGTISCEATGDCGIANVVVAQFKGDALPEIVWSP